MGGSRRYLLEFLSSSAKLSLSLLFQGWRPGRPRQECCERWFPSDLRSISRSDDDAHLLGAPQSPANSVRSHSAFIKSLRSLFQSLSHSVVSEPLRRESRGWQAGNRPPGPPSAAARLCPLRPSSRLVPYFEEAVPGAGAHRHAVLRHPKATDAVVVTR